MPGHRPTHRDPESLQAAAWVYASRGIAAAISLPLVGFGLLFHDQRWFYAAGLAGLVCLVFAFFHAFHGRECRCPVCTGFLFAGMRNIKHPRARRLLGSYRLRTAVEILCTPCYRCHHCGTKVALQRRPPRTARTAGHPSPGSGRTALPPQRPPKPSIVLSVKLSPSRKKDRPPSRPAPDERD